MARIFIAWEMGDSLGHLVRLSAIIHELLAREHHRAAGSIGKEAVA